MFPTNAYTTVCPPCFQTLIFWFDSVTSLNSVLESFISKGTVMTGVVVPCCVLVLVALVVVAVFVEGFVAFVAVAVVVATIVVVAIVVAVASVVDVATTGFVSV